jgi:uncharacterized protein YacL
MQDVDELLEALLGPLIEAIAEALLGALFAFIAGMFVEALRGAATWLKETTPVFLTVVLAFVGAGAGFLSAWLIPHRLLVTRLAIPGVSLILAPIVTALLMWFLGKLIRRSGHWASSLVTLRGGVIFAFSMALVRWYLVVAQPA